MKRPSNFALWSSLVVTGSWSTMILIAMAVIVLLAIGQFLLGAPLSNSQTLGYHAGRLMLVVVVLAVFVGVPTVAWRHRVGFGRGLLAVVAAAGWLVLSALAVLLLLNPVLAMLLDAGLNFLIAAACAVILYRRRRAKRREPQHIADVFS